MAERSKAADCKSVSSYSRWFKSNLFQFFNLKFKTSVLLLLHQSITIKWLWKKKFIEYWLFFFILNIINNNVTKFRYLKKKKWWLNKLHKKSIQRGLRHRFFLKKVTNLSLKFFFKKLYRAYNKIFWPIIIYQIHNRINTYFNKKFVNAKYFLFLNFINEENFFLFKYFHSFLKKNKTSYYFYFFIYAYSYNFIFLKNCYDIYVFKKKNLRRKKRTLYYLILTFKSNKMFINLYDILKRNYLFLSTGFFIKFFEKKKLYKKNKIIRTILIKYLRKFFLLLNLPQTILVLKKNPIFLLEFLNLFNQAIPHKFNEPLTNREILDTGKNVTNFLYFVFLNSKTYVNNKTKKKGRVKRKISRKIIMRNAVTD